ncbi:MAG: hypothetical protein ACR2N5_08060 [Solirubrobacterales bacterium]
MREAWEKYRGWFFWQVALWGVLAVALRLAVVPAEECTPVDATQVHESIEAGADWLERGIRPDGRYRYGYFNEDQRISFDYNNTRHTGVMSALYVNDRIDGGDTGLEYVQDNLIKRDDWTAFAPPGEPVNVGGNSLLIVALMNRREATGDETYDELAKGLGRFLLSQQQDNGSILQYWTRNTEMPIPDLFGKFSTGEAFYAYALLDQAFPGEGWDDAAHLVGEYLATERDEAEGNYRQPDHWAAYGLATLAPDGLSETEVEYARFLAGYFGYLIRYEAQNKGSFLNQLNESGATLGTNGEAAAALWRVAEQDDRLADIREPLAERIDCLAGILVDLQEEGDNPEELEAGAWFFEGYTQMDDQQHAIAALEAAQDVVQ